MEARTRDFQLVLNQNDFDEDHGTLGDILQNTFQI